MLYHFFLILHIVCAVALLSSPASYANEHGATILKVPVAADDFPDTQEKLETLLHHETGLKKPFIYKYKIPQCYENAMQLTPHWLKNHYGTLPLFFVREESATQVQLSHYFFSQAIELIESDEYPNDVSFVSVLDKKIAQTLEKCNQLSLLPFQGAKKSSINLLEHESFLCPLNYEEKQVPITLPISFYLWKKMFKLTLSSNEKTSKQLSCMHQKFQSTFDNTSLTLPTHITFLDVSNKHHVEHLHQNMVHVSSVIVQTHGKQKVVLMPPISEQHPHHHWLDSTGQFLFNKEIDLSASDSVLNNEQRLAHAILYSVYLNPGDMLLVPANWFIYRKSLSPSISLSLNFLSSNTWRLFSFQADSIEQTHEHNHKYLTQEKCAIIKWMDTEIQQNYQNECNIVRACKSIQKVISDATQPVLDLSWLKLSSLPDAIFRIPHLKTLDLSGNKLTSLSLSHMKNLVSLDLSFNTLTSFSLNDAKNLALLNLQGNQLINFFLSHVEASVTLNLAHNRLASFSLNHVKNLASLNLMYNQFISFSLSHVENIGSLNLARNQLTFFSLSHVKNISSLDLEHNQLTSFSLSHVKTLTSLNVSNNKLSRFLSCDLPNITHINLSHNHLSHLDPDCISSINIHKNIELDLRDNPLSNEGKTQIQEDLLKRVGHSITYYSPVWFSLIKHIKNHKMEHEDFINLLFRHNMLPSSENHCLKCPMTHAIAHQVIFFMTSNNRYIIYDAEALIKWMYTDDSKLVSDPYTRESFTLKNLLSAEEPCILEYLKKKLKPVSTKNMDLIFYHKS